MIRSEKPYTKSENVISRFSWHCVERKRSILKKNCFKSSILRQSAAFRRSKLQKGSFEKKAFKSFFKATSNMSVTRVKSSILHQNMAFQRSKLQKGSFEKKAFKSFFKATSIMSVTRFGTLCSNRCRSNSLVSAVRCIPNVLLVFFWASLTWNTRRF